MKQFFMIAALMVLIVASVIAQDVVVVPTQQIQMGTFSTSGNTLENGGGDRQLIVVVNFPKAFGVKPDVIVSITAIDAETNTNLRVRVHAEGVSRDGFTAVVGTWSDSKIHSVSGSWIASAASSATVNVKSKK
jgi:hypothetical protein